ncbi:lipoate--protein ligase [Pelosinus sp. IPA-1]|uniref:lipoate--protein ligase n=1 Tax=Pelosinus sp. IPA-1 TaxID=3029569 RepID=UPI00243614F2|nr:lipoate--protein ligase [Pelosinus sp. IPA-1]GMB00982.1 lipoate--protein ligase [Pelosinus sp. IPA-1]
MLHIINSCIDPSLNLALEEYFLKQAVADDMVILWRNAPTVVIGRNQNLTVEINHPFITEKHIQVARRLSGGGAVYHDLGNLNFTLITAASAIGHNEFSRLTLPVIDALAVFGVQAEFTGRNDLTIAGQKFSGNAQYIHRDRLLHHGTLLFDTDLTILAQALSGSEAKYSTRAVPSMRSKVTTIRRHLPTTVTLTEFESVLIRSIFHHARASYQQYNLSATDRQSIETLACRYRDPAWTYGTLPPYNHSTKQTFSGGTIQVLLNIQNETIAHCKFCGDFFATGDMNDLETALCGTTWNPDWVSKIIIPWLAEHPIHNISPQDLLSCFFPNP